MRLLPKNLKSKRFWIIVSLGVLVVGFIIYRSTGYVSYTPREGDVLFQSLPPVELVRAIEGATNSNYSHCGIVVKENGKWIVTEALGTVKKTSLYLWCLQGNGGRFAAYRLKDEYAKHIPSTILEVNKFLGRPYDSRFRMDDEYLYCSELVYKGFLNATGLKLGKLDRLGDLNWKPYRETMLSLEGGDKVPLDRKMITPVELTRSKYMTCVKKY